MLVCALKITACGFIELQQEINRTRHSLFLHRATVFSGYPVPSHLKYRNPGKFTVRYLWIALCDLFYTRENCSALEQPYLIRGFFKVWIKVHVNAISIPTCQPRLVVIGARRYDKLHTCHHRVSNPRYFASVLHVYPSTDTVQSYFRSKNLLRPDSPPCAPRQLQADRGKQGNL